MAADLPYKAAVKAKAPESDDLCWHGVCLYGNFDMGVAYPREDAALMMNIYLRRGYSIVYMAGRPRQMKVLGKSMCEATLD